MQCLRTESCTHRIHPMSVKSKEYGSAPHPSVSAAAA